jgi:hypothetical protein
MPTLGSHLQFTRPEDSLLIVVASARIGSYRTQLVVLGSLYTGTSALYEPLKICNRRAVVAATGSRRRNGSNAGERSAKYGSQGGLGRLKIFRENLQSSSIATGFVAFTG